MTDINQPSNTLFQYEDVRLPVGVGPALRLITLRPKAAENQILCELSAHGWDNNTGFVGPARVRGVEYILPAPHKRQDFNVDSEVNQKNENKVSSITYEALSYTWGCESAVKQINLNGRLFHVTLNLWRALRDLQDQTADRILWVDAICIDQNDPYEKGDQVSQMHRIYKHAERVIVWLDVPGWNSDLAFEFAERIYSCLKSRGGPVEGPPRIIEHHEAILASTRHLICRENIPAWIALHRLFSRPWWSRAWVLQEITMAKQAAFVCGQKSAAWPIIELAIQAAYKTYPAVEELIKSTMVPDFQDYYNTWGCSHKLWATSMSTARNYRRMIETNRIASAEATLKFLEISQDRLCQYQGDKIYSILGLVPSGVYSAMTNPDYSMSAQEVYRHFVEVFVWGTYSLDILCHSQHSDTQDDLPSWAPDWSRRSRMVCLRTLYHGNFVRLWHFQAIQDHFPAFSKDCTNMAVSGISISNVKRLNLENELLPRLEKVSSDILDLNGNSYRLVNWDFLSDAEELLQSALQALPDDLIIWEDSASIILGMLLLKLDPNRPRRPKTSIYPPPMLLSEVPKPDGSGFRSVYDSIQSVVRCRTVAETNSLELVLAPYWVEVGDLICQFVGCTVPVVLRRNSNGNYKFIGDCYVYGKPAQEMVEILKQVLNGPEEVERFVLV